MREIRMSGSEGGGAKQLSLPLSDLLPLRGLWLMTLKTANLVRASWSLSDN
jgi:hypothetical protein